MEEFDIAKVEEDAEQLERDLILKEKETLEVLKELECTKMVVEDLKLKLQNEASQVDLSGKRNDDKNEIPNLQEEEKENAVLGSHDNAECLLPSSILAQLEQAKLNLTRTTTDLADIRASVELFSRKIEKERASLEKTREKLATNSSRMSYLEDELNQTAQKLQLIKCAETTNDCDNPTEVSKELQRLNSEAEQFKKMGEDARKEVFIAMSEIEQTKARIRTAEIRLVAAKKMKEAAKAAEAVALAEIKALSGHKRSSGDVAEKPEAITLSFEEYTSLTCKAREAEEINKNRVMDAVVEVDQANVSKMDVLRKVEEAAEEVRNSKKALEEALNRVETANREKLAVEEALRKWRTKHSHRRRSLHNATKFKSSFPSHHQREPCLLDVNRMNLDRNDTSSVAKPTLSIGQILSRKLLVQEDIETGMLSEINNTRPKVSLGQMLRTQNANINFNADRENSHKQFPAKRKKLGFGRVSVLLTKQGKKKKPTLDLR